MLDAEDSDSAGSYGGRVQSATDPAGSAAAWFLRCPDGRLIVRRAAGLGLTPNDEHALKVWLRFRAVMLGRPAGILTRAALAEIATDLAGHRFTTDTIPAVPGATAPLLRGDEWWRTDG